MFWFTKPDGLIFGRCTVRQSILLSQVQQNRMVQFLKPKGLISKTGGSRISRKSGETSETMTADPSDWMTPLVHYLKNPSHTADRKV
jgi:hypothetical protein